MSDTFYPQPEGALFSAALMDGMKTESREVRPGVYVHTFTLTEADISAILEQWRPSTRVNSPGVIHITTEMMRSIEHAQRIGRLYRAYPAPRRKIRKCHMRKLQARWGKGRAHIHRVEIAERAREEWATK